MHVKRFRPVCQFLEDGTPVAVLMEFHEGYVSGTDYDALSARLAEAEQDRRDIMRDMVEVVEQLAEALATLEKHGIHLESKGCWCKPTVTDYST